MHESGRQLPAHARYLVIGAGVHGLSTAYHLAIALEARGKGAGSDIVIVDKTDVAGGASGIACGVIRNNYFQPAMRELMAHSVNIWESDPEAFHYHPVGYMQISPDVMGEGVASIHEQQQAIGYESELIEGEADCARYMRSLFDDWQARGITSVLHEKKGGYANNEASMRGLAGKAFEKGVRFVPGVSVTGFEITGDSVCSVQTDRGSIAVDYVVVAVGPWIKQFWDMLELPRSVDVKANGEVSEGVPMWTYWFLQEGTLGVDPTLQCTNSGAMPPVIHVDTDAPLHSDIDGTLITDQMWGIYYKPDFGFGGIQGGAVPFPLDPDIEHVRLEIHAQSPDCTGREDFQQMWCSALAFCQQRFEGKHSLYRQAGSGGVGALTPDCFPVFDVFRQNCYVIADSNHGFKLIGVGELAATEILGGKSALLEPFRFARFAAGELHPVSTSPFPWS